MSERFLVTGATGFLGRALVAQLLGSGHPVSVLHRDSAASAAALADLRVHGAEVFTFTASEQIAALVREAAPDTVIHLATRYVRDHRSDELDQMIEANIGFGSHLLESLAGSSATVVTAMSFFQFDDGRSAPYSVYSATKQAFLEISRFYREVKSLDVREVVLYDTYGPGDKRDKLIPHLLESLVSGSAVALGPSRQLLNLLFVDDVVEGLILAAKPGNPARMTVRAAETVSVGHLVAELEVASGRSLAASFADERPANDLVTRSGQWPTPIGWAPHHSLASGLEATWRAFTE